MALELFVVTVFIHLRLRVFLCNTHLVFAFGCECDVSVYMYICMCMYFIYYTLTTEYVIMKYYIYNVCQGERHMVHILQKKRRYYRHFLISTREACEVREKAD